MSILQRLCACVLPHRSHSIRMNHDGNAANGSPSACLPFGNGASPYLRQWRAGPGRTVIPPGLCPVSHAPSQVYPDSAGTRTNRLPNREMGILLAE
jgi:hypothetical protein